MQDVKRAVINRELSGHGFLLTVGKGFSMRPLLKPDNNLLKIFPPQSKYRKYDVVLFQNSEGDYVLHRIIKIRPEGYITRGDGSILKEMGIQNQNILGILGEFVRDTGKNCEKWIKVTNRRYRCYSRLIVLVSPAVRALLKLQISWKCLENKMRRVPLPGPGIRLNVNSENGYQ